MYSIYSYSIEFHQDKRIKSEKWFKLLLERKMSFHNDEKEELKLTMKNFVHFHLIVSPTLGTELNPGNSIKFASFARRSNVLLFFFSFFASFNLKQCSIFFFISVPRKLLHDSSRNGPWTNDAREKNWGFSMFIRYWKGHRNAV